MPASPSSSALRCTSLPARVYRRGPPKPGTSTSMIQAVAIASKAVMDTYISVSSQPAT